ncbi:hypothetical protein G4B88_007400 [Cannabis sativa]|uniref:Retrotransposon gag domain-containing protein n=1 Tax=Cannabis sativa TaxID=3483 RepID=A0A7J6DRD8_CANSA|nr:hypothetical protein G4B88_007400 [Cannabis sativa]
MDIVIENGIALERYYLEKRNRRDYFVKKKLDTAIIKTTNHEKHPTIENHIKEKAQMATMVRDDVFMAKAQRRPEVRGLMEETLASGSRGETRCLGSLGTNFVLGKLNYRYKGRCGIADSRTGTPATTRMNGLTERYFGLQRLSPPEQLEAAVLCLEGAALNWFRWENQRQAIKSWEELKSLLLRRFRPKAEGTSQLCKITDKDLSASFDNRTDGRPSSSGGLPQRFEDRDPSPIENSGAQWTCTHDGLG